MSLRKTLASITREPAKDAGERGKQMEELYDALRRRAIAVLPVGAIPPREAGICDDCGNPISPARLQALPAGVNRCITCEEKREAEEAGRSGRRGDFTRTPWVPGT